MRFIGDGAPFTRERAARDIARFDRSFAEEGFGHWALEERASGTLIGRAGLLRHADWPEHPGALARA